MEQRRKPRFQTNQRVLITFLGSEGPPETATVRDASEHGLGLQTARAVAPGTCLKIDADDALLLGVVVYCRQENAAYAIGVRLEEMLCGLAELCRALEEFRESRPEPQRLVTAHGSRK